MGWSLLALFKLGIKNSQYYTGVAKSTGTTLEAVLEVRG